MNPKKMSMIGAVVVMALGLAGLSHAGAVGDTVGKLYGTFGLGETTIISGEADGNTLKRLDAGVGLNLNKFLSVGATYHEWDRQDYRNCTTYTEDPRKDEPKGEYLVVKRPMPVEVTECSDSTFKPRAYSADLVAGIDIGSFRLSGHGGWLKNDHGGDGGIYGAGVGWRFISVKWDRIENLAIGNGMEEQADSVMVMLTFPN